MVYSSNVSYVCNTIQSTQQLKQEVVRVLLMADSVDVNGRVRIMTLTVVESKNTFFRKVGLIV